MNGLTYKTAGHSSLLASGWYWRSGFRVMVQVVCDGIFVFFISTKEFCDKCGRIHDGCTH